MVRSIALIAFAGVPLASCNDWPGRYEAGNPLFSTQRAPTVEMHANALKTLNVESLKADIEDLLVRSGGNRHWPADWQGFEDHPKGHYGPMFIRLAWHCSGSYRISDGKGGCTGGNQRFEPVRSWDDNTNLDKARALLAPIKAKYGDALSWGDLIIATGSTALQQMGTPVKQFCFGREDDTDGTNSRDLGTDGHPESAVPACEVQGQCESPLGSTTVGLIYLNPEGPIVEPGGSPVPDPALSAKDIRDAFARMDADDRATVALIGGGHAFGKCHGACADDNAQGLRPSEAFAKNDQFAWKGTCGEGTMQGKGPNVFTSGFEGPWTTNPTTWDNQFFTDLLDHEWEKFIGPGGHWQWRIKNATAAESSYMRLTSDLALLHDDKYLEIVKEFAADTDALGAAFDKAWFKLTHSGGMWSPESKCDTGSMPAWVMEQNNNRMLDSDTVAV